MTSCVRSLADSLEDMSAASTNGGGGGVGEPDVAAARTGAAPRCSAPRNGAAPGSHGTGPGTGGLHGYPSWRRRAPAGADRQRDAERSRQALLAAALEEFSVRRFAGARVADIARRAGVNSH